MEHTPTPWKRSENNWGRVNIHNFPNGGGTNIIADLVGNAEEMDANSAFIVRAVNSHDDLVEALQGFMKCRAYDGKDYIKCSPNWEDFEKAEKALEKATKQ